MTIDEKIDQLLTLLREQNEKSKANRDQFAKPLRTPNAINPLHFSEGYIRHLEWRTHYTLRSVNALEARVNFLYEKISDLLEKKTFT